MPKRFSEADARRIFALAAERQHEAEQSEPGLSLEELEEVGRAVGLDPAFVREAAADALRPEPVSVTKTVLGVPLAFRRERFVRGTVTDEAWSEIVVALRSQFNRSGLVTTIGPLCEWRSHASDQMQPVTVTLSPERDGTRVVIERAQTQTAVGLGVGTATNFLMGLVFLVFASVETGDAGLAVPAAIMLAVALALGVGTYVGMRAHGRRQTEAFDATLDRIGLAVRNAAPLAKTAPEPAAAPEAAPPLDLSDLDAEPADGAPHRSRARA